MMAANEYKLSFTASEINEKLRKIDELDIGSNKIYAQNEEPIDAPDGALWVDMDAEGGDAGGGVVSDEKISQAVVNYLTENPVEGGMTKIEKNLILTLFRNASYTSANMNATFTQLETLWNGSSDDSGGDTHNHSYTSSITTAATCTTAGVRTYTCVCGHSYTESIPATGHNYVDGVCTVCGAADPTYSPDTPEPEVTLTGISASYSGGSVPVGTAANSLTGIVVVAHYSDGTSETVTDYELSGTITDGSNTITVSYGGKTTTFVVTGVAESGSEVVKTPFTGVNLLNGKEFTVLNAKPFGYQVPLELTAGTYYLYDVYKTSSGYNPKLLTFDGSNYTDATSSIATITKAGAFKTGLPNETNPAIEKADYYQPNGVGYLVEITIVLSEDFTGYLNVGATGQWYGLNEAGWSILSTERFNPFKQTLS